MSRRVWKYDVRVGADSTFSVPTGARILHVASQYGDPYTVQVWAEVESDEPTTEHRTFRVHGTNHVVSPGWSYVGTALAADGRLVWHVYEDVTPRVVETLQRNGEAVA